MTSVRLHRTISSSFRLRAVSDARRLHKFITSAWITAGGSFDSLTMVACAGMAMAVDDMVSADGVRLIAVGGTASCLAAAEVVKVLGCNNPADELVRRCEELASEEGASDCA